MLSSIITPSALDFNPRPPWGGRHDQYKGIMQDSLISIHALRGEGDISSIRIF